MDKTRTKVFILVEGAKTDRKLMEKLFTMYGLDTDYEIVSYNTNIYTLYKEMFEDNNPEDMDFLQVLKSREKDPEKRQLFDEAYSDILLIFDLDPQDSGYTPEKIKRMSEFFTESTDMGKLYLNYPMVESFYHMQEIPDPLYENCFASLSELRAGTYKRRATSENRNHDYRKFANTRVECSTVIKQNLNKACNLIGETNAELIDQAKVLCAELKLLHSEERIAVLNTCVFFIPEYDSKLICDATV